jgi:NADH:ubiquinone oxidoreductase subunit F (NADH-binding)
VSGIPFDWSVSVQPGLAPRLFENLPVVGGHRSLASHRRDFPAPPRVRRGGASDLIDEIELAGITGRGGANFPTARKWRSVSSGDRRPVVVVNGAEGEPPAGKDATLLARVPHLVIDGALFAAAAVGADHVYVCIGGHARNAIQSVRDAIAERKSVERPHVKIELRVVPERYVAGESRALAQMLNGGEAVPTSTPAHVAGVAGRPTLVNNAETLAHAALALSRGADWYRSVGTPDEPGTRLVSLSGALPRPVVSEIESGTPLREVFEANGGHPGGVSGVLIGGYYGTWIRPEEAFSSEVSIASLSPTGANPGCGTMHFLPRESCGVSAIGAIAEWFAQESAGQCGPCVFGLAAIADALHSVEASVRTATMLSNIDRWTNEIVGRGGCNLPDGASKMIRSGLAVFEAEVAAHRAGRCEAWVAASVGV